MKSEDYRRMMGLPAAGSSGAVVGSAKKPAIRMPAAVKMTKAETGYRDILLNEFKAVDGYEVLFEPWSFRLKSGVRYTPDFVVMHGLEIALIVETKGSYRLHSAGRSHMAFKIAVAEWPKLYWRFAQKNKDGWSVKNIP